MLIVFLTLVEIWLLYQCLVVIFDLTNWVASFHCHTIYQVSMKT